MFLTSSDGTADDFQTLAAAPTDHFHVLGLTPESCAPGVFGRCLAGIDLREDQEFAFPFLFAASVIMLPALRARDHTVRFSVYGLAPELKYWLGAPGVGTLFITCAPLACARIRAVVSVMPLPET